MNDQNSIVKKEESRAEIEIHQVQPLTKELIRQHNDLIEYVVREEMVEDIHYGIIPGTKNKTLLKPGGDLLKRTFNLIDHYEEVITDEGDSHKTYDVTCNLTRIGGDTIFATGIGVCSTLETKYRYQWQYQNGSKHHQEEIPQEKRPDLYNTCKKMAKKRAMLDAINSFFSPAGFFPGNETDKKYENRLVFEWFPKPDDLQNPEWYKAEIKKCKYPTQLKNFMEEFDFDRKFFSAEINNEIISLANFRWNQMKNKKTKTGDEEFK